MKKILGSGFFLRFFETSSSMNTTGCGKLPYLSGSAQFFYTKIVALRKVKFFIFWNFLTFLKNYPP